jgi:hypothetical protein
MIESKLTFLLKTIDLLLENCHEETVRLKFQNTKDSIAHMAPEILHTGWNRIYCVCADHLNNASNPHHRNCFQIYQQQYLIFKKMQLQC